MTDYCSVTRDGHVFTVTIERPDRLNALHAPAHAELTDVFDDFVADVDAWVAIITGRGDRAFCAGNDLVYQAQGGARTPARGGFGGLTERFDLDKPVIAAVNGYAMGGGFEIALACDLVVASERAVFALPEPHVGLAALAGGLHRLPRQIGLKQAMGMILTGRRVTAEEGQRLGFVNEVTAHEAVLDAARRWAAEICACSPASIRTSKDVVQRGLSFASVQEAMQQRYDSVRKLRDSEDFVEGPRAFAEKRPPNWKGY